MRHRPVILAGADSALGAQWALEWLLREPALPLFLQGASPDALDAGAWAALREAARCSGVLLTDALAARLRPLRANAVPSGAVFWHIGAPDLSLVETAHTLHCTAFNLVTPADEERGHGERDAASSGRALAHACAQRGLAWRVRRVPRLVGHSRTGLSAARSAWAAGLGALKAQVDAQAEQAPADSARTAVLRVELAGLDDLRVMPIDTCARALLDIGADAASAGTARDLPPNQRIALHDLLDATAGVLGTAWQAGAGLTDATAPEQQLRAWLAGPRPHGPGTAPPDHALDSEALRRHVAGGVLRHARVRGGSRETALFVNQHALDAGYNLVDAVLSRAATRPAEAIALSDTDGDLRWHQLPGAVHAAARALSDSGLHAEQPVALIANDSRASAVAMLGLLFIGAVAVRINPQVPAHQIEALLQRGDIGQLICDDDLAATLQAVLPPGGMLHALSSIVPPGLDAGAAAGREGSAAAPVPLAAATAALDQAFGVFTSGSTGVPQLVLHTHVTPLVAAERYGAQVLDIRSSDVSFSASRTSFAFGLQNLFMALLHGAHAVLAPPRLSADTLIETLARLRPSVVFAVPTVYQLLLTAGVTPATLDLSRVRALVSAGEPLPAAVAERWQQVFGLPLLDSLGSTEVFSTYLSNLIGTPGRGATGKLMPGFDVFLRAEDGCFAPEGTPGVLWIRGPSVIMGYPARGGEALFQDGWFCTKDVFRRDADGWYHFCGRQGDMFKVGGQWVSPVEIEAVLREHPDVREAAVVAGGGDTSTLRPVAFVVPQDAALYGTDAEPARRLAEALRQRCIDQLGRWKQPGHIEFVASLPRTLNGKLRRLELAGAARAAHIQA